MDNRKFPPHARGYLYYYLAHNAPALSGQVRFRVTGINDPALFSSGEDLLRSDHLPWRMPLLSLLLRKYYTAMLHRLVDEGLVSERVLQIASSLPPEAQQANVGSTRVIHAFGQPFLLHFGRARQPFYFVGADTVRQATFEPVAISRGNRGSWLATIRGSALCYFEKSARPEHAGRRVVVCRAVRIIKPMELTGILSIPGSLLPREGELIRTTFPRAQDSPEWSFDIDDNLSLAPDTVRARFAAGLDLLYDNEARAGGPVGW
ncbi:uncharacterized protein TRAVEDRAFT_68891 [Trametes versicolor FP-101664 SS1]|uniref:uncharacterized protein n=1 Tax=Trametes versicolor (strain FP-101664) TaxID=717944 RepID=UPI0004622CD3|nr:uncharacterized protein TRAVEDRAFT_68891 [Trametes versicolor FP-101664 SS1]EIW62467.1 hypothetical protein TRAVEDRAFT_68891 [Trametes versicolor FP-101664 SS1]